MISDQIALLNNTMLESLEEKDRLVILKKFTQAGLKILKADFGFAWWKNDDNKRYSLAYKTFNTPYNPNPPRNHGGNYMVQKTKTPLFVPRAQKEKYPKKYDVKPYMASYVIIPIFFQKNNYGNIVFCYKKTHIFSKEDKILCTTFGNSLAQAITIQRLYFNLKDFKNHLDKTLDSVFIFDPVTFKIEYANIGAEKQLGFTQAELLNKTFFDIESKADMEKFRKLVTPLFWKKQDSLSLETSFQTKQGKSIPIELFLQLSGSLKGRRKFLTIAHNITERKRVEHESAQLMRQKDEFLGIASHELKTPVTTIKGFTQLLAQSLPKKNTGQTYYMEKINYQVDKLTRLVNDLLDVSRIENGKLKFRRRMLELHEHIENVTADLQVSYPNHKIILKLKGQFWIYGDTDRIGQVIINLVSNAIKYSPKSRRVIISLSKADNFAKVSIEDFGIGIDEKNQQKVFERFFQAKHKGDTYPGLGLGLYISSKIIKSHNGEIFCYAKKGKGSIFTFTLPYKKCKI